MIKKLALISKAGFEHLKVLHDNLPESIVFEELDKEFIE